MNGDDSVKEWFKLNSSPTGTTVTCTQMQGNLTAKITVKAFIGQKEIKAGMREARKRAGDALQVMQEALKEMDR